MKGTLGLAIYLADMGLNNVNWFEHQIRDIALNFLVNLFHLSKSGSSDIVFFSFPVYIFIVYMTYDMYGLERVWVSSIVEIW